MIEIICHIEPLQDIAAVTVGDALPLVGQLSQVNGQTLHVLFLSTRIATCTWIIVCVNIDTVQVHEPVISIHLLGNEVARYIHTIITRLQQVGIARLHVTRIQARDTIKEMEAPTVAPRHQSCIARLIESLIGIHAQRRLQQ